jgi:hypothetical protein
MKFTLMILLFSIAFQASAQERFALYKDAIPNAIHTDTAKFNRNIPEIFVYKPSEAVDKHMGILIIPGGGYSHIAMDHEGHDVAKELIKSGFTAFVLKYRLPSPNIMVDKSIGPIQDAQRAMQFIRNDFPALTKVGVIVSNKLHRTLCILDRSNTFIDHNIGRRESIFKYKCCKPRFYQFLSHIMTFMIHRNM